MKFTLPALAAIGLAGCIGPPVQEPSLPEGVPTATFSFTDDSYLRGVNGSYNTSPRGRPAAILDVTYELVCIAENAQTRVQRAQTLLDDTYVIATPIYFDNPREQNWWRRDASRLVEPTGCIVETLTFVRRTTEPAETSRYLLRNFSRLPQDT